MDIKKDLSSNQIILLTIPSGEYNPTMIKIIKQVEGNVCYVTANKTFDSLRELFKKKSIKMQNIVFIDSISKTIRKTPDQSDQVYYVSSPGALTELDLVIDKFLRHEFDYLIFDSITNLTTYQKPEICAKFMTSLTNKIKKTKTKAIFYSIGDSSEKLPSHLSMLADKVIKIKE